MKLDIQTRWLRVLIEFFPEVQPIRRYRVLAAPAEVAVARDLARRIGRRLRGVDPSS